MYWILFPCEFCEIFKNTYFEEHLRTAGSDNLFKPYHATGFFQYPLKTSENLWVNKILDLGHYPELWNGLIFSIDKSPDLLRHHKEVWKQKFKFLLF